MTKYFLISAAFAVLAGCSAVSGIKRAPYAIATDATVWKDTLRSDIGKNTYRVTLTAGDKEISGICILKHTDDGWRGTFINEMGAKAFDFAVNSKGCELLNVVPLMDKWYIRKTVAEDLHFLFEADNPEAPFAEQAERFEQDDMLIVNYKKKQLVRTNDGRIKLTNRKRNISYQIHQMYDIDRDKVIL